MTEQIITPTGPIFGQGSEDYRQAEWLAAELQNKWRFDHTMQRWHHFDGVRWAIDKVDLISESVATAAAAALARDTWSVGGPNLGAEGRKAMTALLKRVSQQRALEALASFPEYGTDGADWDQDPYLLGCTNGVVDLRTGKLRKGRPEDKITKSTGVKFKPLTGEADELGVTRAKIFLPFLSEVTSDYDFTPNNEIVTFLLSWFGASLFGMAPEQRFLLMIGIGRNGKGALKHAVMAATGEYAVQPDANLYSRSHLGPARSSEARADLMALKGERLVFCSEPNRGEFNEELLKAHTGGDIITARGLYQKHAISWEPTHSITFLVNDAPSIEDIGPSMASRTIVVDFRHRYEGANEDKGLYDKLAAEKEDILAILVWRAALWYSDWVNGGSGLVLPARVVEQSAAFIERNDVIAECLREAFEMRLGVEASGQAVYDAYKSWFRAAGIDGEPFSMPKLARELEKKGFQKSRSSTSRFWKGLRPLSQWELAGRRPDEEDESDE